MEIVVKKTGIVEIAKSTFKCILGKKGITSNKKEGDNKTPRGLFILRSIMYRPDKIKKPKTNLPTFIIKKNHVCCDDPNNSNYNKIFETKDFYLSERLWRKDSLYDICIVIGYNDSPIIKGKGSAIFLHLMKKNSFSTEGCIAIKKKNMISLLKYYPTRIRIL
tara:strand:- start:7021 stop:7509 length:489 start_codon:yes stop_codon:yes gene_type:complete